MIRSNTVQDRGVVVKKDFYSYYPAVLKQQSRIDDLIKRGKESDAYYTLELEKLAKTCEDRMESLRGSLNKAKDSKENLQQMEVIHRELMIRRTKILANSLKDQEMFLEQLLEAREEMIRIIQLCIDQKERWRERQYQRQTVLREKEIAAAEMDEKRKLQRLLEEEQERMRIERRDLETRRQAAARKVERDLEKEGDKDLGQALLAFLRDQPRAGFTSFLGQILG